MKSLCNFVHFFNLAVIFVKEPLAKALGLRSAYENLLSDIRESDKGILKNLIYIRLLSFAFLTSPILSLIPYVVTGNKELGLLNFAVGTVSIIVCLYLFRKFRSQQDSLTLIKLGSRSVLILSGLTAVFLIISSIVGLTGKNFAYVYLFLQIFSGVPFSLISGIDSKLSKSIYNKIRLNEQKGLSPHIEFRTLKTLGSTAATALGAFIWCIIILLSKNTASEVPAYYSIIFILNMFPSIFLLGNLARLRKRLAGIKDVTDADQKTQPIEKTPDEPSIQKQLPSQTKESIISIGCFEGLLQFSQFYFSISALKQLFDSVKGDTWYLILLIPILFFFVNFVEQLGTYLFKNFAPRLCGGNDSYDVGNLKRRQHLALLIILVSSMIFVIHYFTLSRFEWGDIQLSYISVIAYALFNFIKGFAGGLSEDWNAVLDTDSNHNEAVFTTYYSLFGRIFQVAAILVYPVITKFAESDNLLRADTLIRIFDFSPPTATASSIGAMLTISIFGLFAANVFSFIWLGYAESKEHNILRTIIEALTQPEKRLALFTQSLRTLFICFLILSNLLSVKLFDLKGIQFNHGSIFYILSFVVLHLIAAFEDLEAATKTVFHGILVYLLFSTVLTLAGSSSGTFITPENYNNLFHMLGYNFMASFLAYSSVIVLNILLMIALLRYFGAKQSLLITAAVTCVTQLLDTIIFVSLAYGGSNIDTLSLFFGQFTVKFSVYLIMYFPIYFMVCFFKKFLRFNYKV